MSQHTDVLFITEYIKNVLYFATVRQGKILKNTVDTHYFSIDDELIYENYYSDFGPLNLGCVYKYCKILNEKLKIYLNKQCIVHYTSIDPKKKSNAAFLLGCYGVLYLSLQPKEALKPLLVHGQSYRPFQDATQGDSNYTISLMDCLQGFAKAHDLHFFNFQDFNYVEYDKLDKIQGGDLNWILPAFIGPVDYCMSLYHPPEMYIDYFLENNVKIVIRLNKNLYDGNVFNNAGITHYNLFFPDGTCPPRHILFKFLQISEECDGAIAVHCKAGLGRTGSLIGCYLMKHYRMTAHEAIAWMRICRPGSVIGHQQGWLEELQPWLNKQGNLYRKRNHHDIDKLPTHEYGIYSIAEKSHKQRPLMFIKSESPPPPVQRLTRSDLSQQARPQASKTKEESFENEEEVFITACDLTIQPPEPVTRTKGCVIKNSTVTEEYDSPETEIKNIPLWKKILCCKPCIKTCYDKLWMLAVRCTKIAPNKCSSNKCCILLDLADSSKTNEKSQFRAKERMNSGHTYSFKRNEPVEISYSGRKEKMTIPHNTPNTATELAESLKTGWKEKISYWQKSSVKGLSRDINPPTNVKSRRGSGAGEPRVLRSSSKNNSAKLQEIINEPNDRNRGRFFQVPIYHTSQTPIAKTLDDARNILLRSSLYNDKRMSLLHNQREYLSIDQKARHLDSAIVVKPQYSHRKSAVAFNERPVPGNFTKLQPSTFTSVPKSATLPQQRRRLGRSPSPPVTRIMCEQSRATNTTPQVEVHKNRDSKSNLKEELSRLKLLAPRNGSTGAASLGARRDAPPDPRQAPSVRSDERPLATQGDMLNSIKFQRRFHETITAEKLGIKNDNPSMTIKDKQSRNINSRTSPVGSKPVFSEAHRFIDSREKPCTGTSKGFFRPPRPSSPKGRQRSPHPPFY